MKNIIYTLLITFLFSMISLGQGQGPGSGPHNPPFGRGGMKKIRELEKVKLIEALNLNEENTVKFFARRNQHQNDLRNLEDKLDGILDDMNTELNKGKDVNEGRLKKLTDDFYATTTDIHKAKNDFLMSVKDILTTEQVAKLIVFDRNFREEMRQILMKERMKRRGNPQDE